MLRPVEKIYLCMIVLMPVCLASGNYLTDRCGLKLRLIGAGRDHKITDLIFRLLSGLFMYMYYYYCNNFLCAIYHVSIAVECVILQSVDL